MRIKLCAMTYSTDAFRDSLRRALDARSWTQKDLRRATRNRVAQGTISNAVMGKNITLENVALIAEAIGMPMWRVLVDPGSDVARLVDGFMQADEAGRSLIKQIIEREVALATVKRDQ